MSIEQFFAHELNDWEKGIDFYTTEFNMLEERLREVLAKNTKASVTAGAEHFQNQFIIQKDNLALLRERLGVQKQHLEAEIKRVISLDELAMAESQHFLRESVHLSEKIFLELRHSFYRFLSKVL